MFPKTMRAVATAFLVGTAAVGAATVLSATPVQAAVRASVGKPLQAAIAAANSGNYEAAMSELKKASSTPNLSAEEKKYITQTQDFIAVKSGGKVGVTNAVGAQAKFAADYRARKYKDVIADADLLKKYNALTPRNKQLIAQAYYLLRDFSGCMRYTRSVNIPDVWELQMRCAYDAHDDATYSETLVKLVASTKKPEYWNRLIKFAEGAKALSDQQSLDIYRVKYMSGAMNSPDDYFVLAQYALQFGFASEAKSVIDAGVKKGLLKGSRAQRLEKMANDSIASNLRNLPRTVKEANSAKTGDLLVKLGEDYCGMGRGKDAVAAVKAGIAKGVKDKDNAQIRLGQAYYAAGDKTSALHAFDKVKASGNTKLVADMWSLLVRTH